MAMTRDPLKLLDEIETDIQRLQAQKIELADLKKEIVPRIADCINKTENISELSAIHTRLNKAPFTFLKTHQWPQFFKEASEPTESWATLATLFIKQLYRFSAHSYRLPEDYLMMFDDIKHSLKSDGQNDPRTIILDTKANLTKMINEDDNLPKIYDLLKNNEAAKVVDLDKIDFSIVLQTKIEDLREFYSSPSTNFLDPLRYIAAMVTIAKLSYLNSDKPNLTDFSKRTRQSCFMAITRCIKNANDIDALNQILLYLQKPGFNFLREHANPNLDKLAAKRTTKTWDSIIDVAKLRAREVDPQYQDAKKFNELLTSPLPQSNINKPRRP